MKTEAEIRAALRDWIIGVGGRVSREELNDQTPIIEERIISSLQVMELILFLERLSGRRVEAEQLKPGAFSSIDALYENFFGAARGGDDDAAAREDGSPDTQAQGPDAGARRRL